MRKLSTLALVAGLIIFGLTAPAHSATIGFKFTITLGNPDQPTLRLENTSTDGIQLVDFLMTIGDTAYYFDWINGVFNQKDPGGDLSANLLIGDSVAQNMQGTDLFEYLFTGFDPGDIARYYSELDQDGTNSSADCRTVFFSNGDSTANAVVRVLFRDGTQLYPLTITLPDDDSKNYYEFTPSQELPTVPTPGAIWLLGSGLLGLTIIRRRQRQSP